MSFRFCLAFLALMPAATFAQVAPKSLFAGDEPIRLSISGGVDLIAKGGPESREGRPGTVTIAGISASLPVLLEPRGITRRQRDVCQFPPLRVTFNQPPPAESVFAGQRRLKLVSHCRAAEGFQNYLLLEYAAYRLYNNPVSYTHLTLPTN